MRCEDVALVLRKRGAYREVGYRFRRVDRDDEENEYRIEDDVVWQVGRPLAHPISISEPGTRTESSQDIFGGLLPLFPICIFEHQVDFTLASGEAGHMQN